MRDGELAVLHAHLVQPPPVLSSALQVPKGLDAVIARALAKAKDDRYPTCGELIAAARQAALARRSTPVPVVVADAAAVAVAGSEPTGDARELAPAASEVGGPPEAAVPPAAPPPPVRQPRPRAAADAAAGRRSRSSSASQSWQPWRVASPRISRHAARALLLRAPRRGRRSRRRRRRRRPQRRRRPRRRARPGGARSTGLAAALAKKFKDPAIAGTCSNSPHPGGLVTLNCTSTTTDGQPVRLHVDLFRSHSFVKKNYNDDALGPYKAAGGTLDAGACTRTTWSGEGPWARGRRACFVAANTVEGCKGLGAAECSIVYWYDEPSHVAVRATVAGAHARSAPQLSVWWDAHKGDFGG